MKELTVTLDSYRTKLTLMNLSSCTELPEGVRAEQVLWVSDTQVWSALTGPDAPDEFRAQLTRTLVPGQNLVVMETGEANKTWEQVASVIQHGFARGIARDGYIIGIGGGVVCDMAAFAASVYMRGCNLILVPTTLLAQVDAALGGKTGINFGGYKNMVGTFYPAAEVRVVPEFNTTLSNREYLSGLAEVIKHAWLADPELLELLVSRREAVLARQPEVLSELVWKSLLVKAQIVQADFKEQSIRAHLNLGHTFAHGLESAAGFGAWTHGEAVAWGMAKAARLSVRLGLASTAYADELVSLLHAYGYRTEAPDVAIDPLIKAMLMDKKKKEGAVRFVLQRGKFDTVMQAVQEPDVRAVLEKSTT